MTSRLFVYGILLDADIGARFGMEYPRYSYAVVEDFTTRALYPGDPIVEAVRAPGFALTGRIVEIPDEAFQRLDMMEGAYKRILVKTSQGEAFMYAARDVPGEDHSTYPGYRQTVRDEVDALRA